MKLVREYLITAFAILCLFAARSSLADHYLVPSGSMQPTLLPGDRVFVDKQAYGLRVPFTLVTLIDGQRPARGDVVIFDSPEDGTRLIKRVVAVAGDVVEVRGGNVHIDGASTASSADASVETLPEGSVSLDLRRGGGPELGPTRVPPGHVLVLGDARGNSRDSRYFGFVPERAIYGKAEAVFYRADQGFDWVPL
jgi:signal peptidase I